MSKTMGGTMQHELLQEIILKLENSQDTVERCAFDAINQHDRVIGLVNELTVQLNHTMTRLEAMSYSIDETKSLLQEAKAADLSAVSEQLEEQGMQLIELGQMVQLIMEEQAKESEVIHELESKTLQHRDDVEAVKEAIGSGDED